MKSKKSCKKILVRTCPKSVLFFLTFPEKVVQRGDQLENLEEKTLELESEAGEFRGRTFLPLSVYFFFIFRCYEAETDPVVADHLDEDHDWRRNCGRNFHHSLDCLWD